MMSSQTPIEPEQKPTSGVRQFTLVSVAAVATVGIVLGSTALINRHSSAQAEQKPAAAKASATAAPSDDPVVVNDSEDLGPRMTRLIVKHLDPQGNHIPVKDIRPLTKLKPGTETPKGMTKKSRFFTFDSVTWRPSPGARDFGVIEIGMGRTPGDLCEEINEGIPGQQCQVVDLNGTRVVRAEINESTLRSVNYAFRRPNGYVTTLKLESASAKHFGDSNGIGEIDVSPAQIAALLTDDSIHYAEGVELNMPWLKLGPDATPEQVEKAFRDWLKNPHPRR